MSSNQEVIYKFDEGVQIVKPSKTNQALFDRIYVNPNSVDGSSPVKTLKHVRVQMDEYYKGSNARFDPCLSHTHAAQMSLGFNLPTHSTVQAKSSHSSKNPKITNGKLKKLNREDSNGKKCKVTTNTVLKRTPENDVFVLLVNSWTSITIADIVYDGNF